MLSGLRSTQATHELQLKISLLAPLTMTIVRPTMSHEPFSSDDFTDGEIHRLIPGSQIWHALFHEHWQNCTHQTKQYYLDRLQQPHHFSGIVVSVVRSQIELTYIPTNHFTGGAGDLMIVCITLNNVNRFISDV